MPLAPGEKVSQRHLLGLPCSLEGGGKLLAEAAAARPRGGAAGSRVMLAGFKEGGSRSRGGGYFLGEPCPEFSRPLESALAWKVQNLGEYCVLEGGARAEGSCYPQGWLQFCRNLPPVWLVLSPTSFYVGDGAAGAGGFVSAHLPDLSKDSNLPPLRRNQITTR